MPCLLAARRVVMLVAAAACREILELATHLEALQAFRVAVEAISHGEPPEVDAWPVVVTFRNSFVAVSRRSLADPCGLFGVERCCPL